MVVLFLYCHYLSIRVVDISRCLKDSIYCRLCRRSYGRAAYTRAFLWYRRKSVSRGLCTGIEASLARVRASTNIYTYTYQSCQFLIAEEAPFDRLRSPRFDRLRSPRHAHKCGILASSPSMFQLRMGQSVRIFNTSTQACCHIASP